MTGIAIQKIEKHYGAQTVLKQVTTEIAPNTIYGLLGRNGAGKSTLLNILTNRIYASSGTVTLDDKSVVENDQALGQFYLMSELDLYPDRWTVDQLFAQTKLLYGGFDLTYAQELVGKFNLDSHKRLGKLSTGYRSIAKLITALCVPANYIFLDEPVLGLDANHRELFYQELLQSYTDHPRTFVISTHLIEEVANLIEHVLVLDQGRFLIDADTESVLALAHAISGPAEAVSAYTENLNVIGQDHLGKIQADYVYGPLDDNRPIPDTVSVERMDLQKLFINLTNEMPNAKGATTHE